MNKIYPITNKRKKKIYLKIMNNIQEIFDMEYLENSLNNVSTLDEIDIRLLLKENLNEYFKCKFINGNFAWISKNENNKYRYFSKGYITYSLDIYDILTVLFNCKFSKLLSILNELYPKNKIKTFQMEQVKITTLNQKIIIDLIEKNNNVKEVLSDKIDIYMALNDFCSDTLLIEKFYKNNSIFFISTRYLKEKYNLKYSISTINQVVNLYSLLGIINKVPESDIDCDIYNEYKKRKIKDNKVAISFYSMPSLVNYKDTLIINCDILNKQNIKYYNIKKDNKIDLEESEMESIYNNNKGGGDKTVRAKECKKQKDSLEFLFERNFVENGYVSKESIIYNVDISTTLINKKWKELIQKYDLVSVKPTKKVKEKLGLTSNLEIGIKKGVRMNDL